MNFATIMAEELPLGLNFLEILLNMLTLAILIVAIRFLLYKPIKKFIAKRQEKYIKESEESAKKLSEAEELKKQYEAMLNDAKRDAYEIAAEAERNAKFQANEIIDNARKTAEAMLEKSAQDIEIAKASAKETISADIVTLAVDMASKILEREVSAADNDVAIEKVLSEWTGSHNE